MEDVNIDPRYSKYTNKEIERILDSVETIDDTLTPGSDNPVKSGAVASAVDILRDADMEISKRMDNVIDTAEADHVRAESDHLASKEWNDHPPYIGDGTNGEKNFWYVWVDHAYQKSAYAKGDNIDYSTMTADEYQRLVDNVKADLVFSSVDTCEEIVEELS